MIKSRATSVEIPSGEEFSVPIVVEVPGSKLSWCFELKEADIGFRIERSSCEAGSASGACEVCFEESIYSANSAQCGETEVSMGSVYRFIWDNSYSLFAPKQIFYSISVRSPRPEASPSGVGARLRDGLSFLRELSEREQSVAARLASSPSPSLSAADAILLRSRREQLQALLHARRARLAALARRRSSLLFLSVLRLQEALLLAFLPSLPLPLHLLLSGKPLEAAETPSRTEETSHGGDLVPLPPTAAGTTGWYYRADGSLFYCVHSLEAMRDSLGPFSPEELNALIDRAQASRVLIACLGTEQGQNGVYINRRGVLSRWERIQGEWRAVEL